MIRRSVLLVVSALVMSGMVSSAFAAGQSSFSISPSPLATPVFDGYENDLKIGATFLQMKSSASTTAGRGFKLDGYGITAAGRSAYSDQFAIDYAIGVISLNGHMGAGNAMKLDGVSVPISVDLEVQPYKNNVFNVIVFAGPAFNISSMNLDNVPAVFRSNVVRDSWTIDSYLYGLQGGVQMGLRLGNVLVDIFGMADRKRGTQDITKTFSPNTSDSIPAFSTTSYGLRSMYVPWGLTLGAMRQDAWQRDDNGTKTYIYTISWSHRF